MSGANDLWLKQTPMKEFSGAFIVAAIETLQANHLLLWPGSHTGQHIES